MFDVRKQIKLPEAQLKKWYSQTIQERNQLNNLVIDEKILDWNELMDNIPKRKLRPFHDKTNVVFFHIPKTAGTTLDNIITKNLPVWDIFKQHGVDFDKNVAAFYKAGTAPRVILGHNDLSDYFYQLIDRKKLVHFTTIREPVARVISYYDFLRAQPTHPSHDLAMSLGIEEFVLSPRADEVSNSQAFRLLGLLKGNQYKKDKRNQDQLIEDAIYQLLNRFTFFGITEKFDYFLLMMSQAMKWKEIYYQRKNVTLKKFKTDINELSPRTIEIIKEKNQVDIGLYKVAAQEFDNRCAQLGIDKQKVENFNNNNKYFNTLLEDSIIS